MTTPIYPILASDDPDFDSWKENPSSDPTMRSEKMSGLVATRPRFTTVPKQWEYQYLLLTDADKQLLEMFERDTVKYGAIAFWWPSLKEAYGADARAMNTTYVAGQIVQPPVPNGRSYKCTVGGKTHASVEPTWPTTEGLTVADGAATWKENSYMVRFGQNIVFSGAARVDFWKASVVVVQR